MSGHARATGRDDHGALAAMGITIFAIGFGLVATAAIFVGSGPRIAGTAPVLAAAGQAALLAGGSLMAGAVLGLLFAVPRVTDPTAEGRVTTNLAQISDWVTKMLVGAALVGLANHAAVWRAVSGFAEIGDGGDWSGRVGATIVGYFAIMGFVSGFFMSRVQFASLLERADAVEQGLRVLARLPPNAHAVRLTLDEVSAVQAVMNLGHSDLRNDIERRAWAKAQLVGFQGDRSEARRIYERLLKRISSPDLYAEYAALMEAMGAAPVPPAELPPNASSQLPDAELSPAAAIDRMFASLYEPDGFNRVIEIGESLVKKVQNDRMWAYLACAYGQKHAHHLRTGGTHEELLAARERALFAVKQALDLDAGWRPTLRSLWDANAIRADGDDDLVTFSGDPQFAALLEPEAVNRSNALASGIENALSPQRLVKYQGKVQMWLASADGTPLKGEVPWLDAERTYRLVISLVPDAVDPDAPGSTLAILEGDDLPQANFDLRPDAPDIRFSPDRGSVVASLSAVTPSCDFSFQAPNTAGEHEIWLELLQGRRTVRTLCTTFEVCA